MIGEHEAERSLERHHARSAPLPTGVLVWPLVATSSTLMWRGSCVSRYSPGDVVVMVDLSAHKVVETCERTETSVCNCSICRLTRFYAPALVKSTDFVQFCTCFHRSNRSTLLSK
jgi:hypothetical protein